nr:MAG TPA: hypothetical protein [Caudoviricetes sp.]
MSVLFSFSTFSFSTKIYQNVSASVCKYKQK